MDIARIAQSALAMKGVMNNQQMSIVALKQQQDQGERVVNLIANATENLAVAVDGKSGVNLVV